MPQSDDQPNVLCFVTDQQHYEHLGCMGNETIQTPHVDALAEEGVTCERAYVTNPVCMPSRASMLTGRMPRETGVKFNGAPLDDRIPTLADVLGDAGYQTYSAGKLHLSHYSTPSAADPDDLDPDRHPECRALWDTGRIESCPEPYYGFETVDLTVGHSTYITGEYLNWLEAEYPAELDRIEPEGAAPTDRFDDVAREEAHYNRWIANRTRAFLHDAGDEPFFAWCSFPDPHPTWAAPDPWEEMYDPDEMPDPVRREGELADLPPHYDHPDLTDSDADDTVADVYGVVSEQSLREKMATDYGMTSFVDQEIGRVMETLESESLREDTIVIFLSDHGNFWGQHWQGTKDECKHLDDIARVPFIWSCPDRLPTNRRVETVVSLLDLVPTVLDLCDVPAPEPGHEGYAEPGCEVPALPGASLRSLFAGETDRVHDGVCIEGDSYDGLRARTYVTDEYKLTRYPGHSYGQLYDLQEDPDELYNRWDDPDYADVRDRLTAELADEYVRSECGLPRKPGSGA